jgi:hypothetical protein
MERYSNQMTPFGDLQIYLSHFGQKVSQLCDLESDCHLCAEDAYDEIRNLWLELRNSRPEIVDMVTKMNETEQLNI